MEWKLDGRPKEERLDHALRAMAAQDRFWSYLSRSSWDELFESGKIQTLTGRRLKPGARLSELQEPVRVLIEEPQGILPTIGAIGILYQSKDILIVDKASGISTYPLRAWEKNTLANLVAGFLQEAKIMEAVSFTELAEAPLLEGGLVQRLDRDTSGIVSIALNMHCKSLMREEFMAHRFEKKYLALVHDIPDWKAKVLRGFLRTKSKELMEWNEREGDECELHCSLLAQGQGASLIEVTTRQGGRHVVRAGLSFLGHPLLGDIQYGQKPNHISTHQLHASHIQYLGDARFDGAQELQAGIGSRAPDSFWSIARSFGVASPYARI